LETGKKRRYFAAAQSVIKFGKRWKRFVSFTPRLFYPKGSSHPYHSFDRSLGSSNAGIDVVAPLFMQKINILVLQLTTSCCYRLVTYFGRGTPSD
jgi:hypothetical protein